MSIIISRPLTIAMADVRPHFRALAVHFHRARSQIVWRDFLRRLTTRVSTVFRAVQTLLGYCQESGTPLLYSRQNTAVGSLRYRPSESIHSLEPVLMCEKEEQAARSTERRSRRTREAGCGRGDRGYCGGYIGRRHTGKSRARCERLIRIKNVHFILKEIHEFASILAICHLPSGLHLEIT
jgi:hypothetical protein